MSDIFAGDVLLTDSPDGGAIAIENGLVKCDKAFSTAVFLSLFGGNEDDAASVENTDGWWGNYVGKPGKNEKMLSRFQNFVRCNPLTSKNLKLAELYAANDLDWLKEEKIADEIIVCGKAGGINKAVFIIEIKKNGKLITKEKYGVQWEAAIYGL